ncbi:MAG TPA: CHASE domain-containing protein [Rhizomicrobium sp.]|nr:CHASE domain-containing protein [Rhizomicrobium sp.]
MLVNRNRTKSSLADLYPVIVVAALGLILSVCAFAAVRGYFGAADRQQFQRNATYYGEAFKSDVEHHVNSLVAIKAFVSASHEVDRWAFSAFADQVLPQNSGFQAVLWLPQVTQAKRKNFERVLQNDGLYGLTIRELDGNGQLVDARIRARYFPVAYIEPFDSNSSLVGLDLLNDRHFATLFRNALQSGRMAASPPLSNFFAERSRGPVVLAAFPMNRERASSDRLTNPVEGIALGVLDLGRLTAKSAGASIPLQSAVAYRSGRRTSVLLSNDRIVPLDAWLRNARFHAIVPFTIADRQFLFVLRSTGSGSALYRLYIPLGAAFLALALTGLLLQSMLATTLGKRKVEKAVVLRTAELHRLNATLQEEIVQRRETEAQLRIAKEKAESANRAKSSFLATMSHELRTPLNAIIGFSGILVEGSPHSQEQTRDYLGEIRDNGSRLLDLINDILEMTQMEAERASLSDHVFLPDIIEAVMGRMQPAADRAEIELHYTMAEHLPVLLGDGKRLQKALLHLLSNALKFTAKGGCAQIAAWETHGEVVVEVRDNGAGMPPDIEAKVLDLFSQSDASFSRKHEGTGLGLAFVRKVADHHEAVLKIVSKLGEGTQISLEFPRHRVLRIREVA